jgi:hypothetical protein
MKQTLHLSPFTMPPNKRNAYFAGSGIASFAGAAFLIQDAFNPEQEYSGFRGTQDLWRLFGWDRFSKKAISLVVAG